MDTGRPYWYVDQVGDKKTAAITETFGISSRSIFRIVAAAITTVPTKPMLIPVQIKYHRLYAC